MTYKYKKIPGLNKLLEVSLGLIVLGEALSMYDEAKKMKLEMENERHSRRLP